MSNATLKGSAHTNGSGTHSPHATPTSPRGVDSIERAVLGRYADASRAPEAAL